MLDAAQSRGGIFAAFDIFLIFVELLQHCISMRMDLEKIGLCGAIVGGILTVGGAFTQYYKNLADAKEKIEQYESLLKKSNDLLESAALTINKQDSLLVTQNEILDKSTQTATVQNEILEKATQTILTQNEILSKSAATADAQGELFAQQIHTLRTLIGSTQPPLVEMEINDNDIHSISAYKLVFTLKNLDDYPLRDVEVLVEDRFIHRSQNRDFKGYFGAKEFLIDEIVKKYRAEEGVPKKYQTILTPQSKVFHESLLSTGNESSSLTIKVFWPFGSYELLINLSTENYLPKFEASYLQTPETHRLGFQNDRDVERYFRVVNKVDERTARSKLSWIEAEQRSIQQRKENRPDPDF